MEVHAQVTSQAKLFSGASTAFGGEPNSHVSLVDAAMPGMLPVINEECVAQAVRTGLGLKAKINLQIGVRPQELFLSRPAAGLPDQPVQVADRRRGRGRRSTCRTARPFTVGIERLHLEQDAGKSLHDQHPTMSFVDLNRSGVALMEIVSKPDMRSADEAKAYLAKLRTHPALPRHLRRRHGEGQPARRRQRLGAPAGRAARHPLRDQERQLDPLHRPGDRVRGAPPDRDHRGRRHDRAGDAAVRSGQGRDALDAHQGGGARLPLLPRSRPAAARADAGLRRRARSATCRNCRTPRRRASCATTACRLRRRRAGRRARDARTTSRRSRDAGRDAKARGQLGDQRAVRPPQQGRHGASPTSPVSAGAARRASST